MLVKALGARMGSSFLPEMACGCFFFQQSISAHIVVYWYFWKSVFSRMKQTRTNVSLRRAKRTSTSLLMTWVCFIWEGEVIIMLRASFSRHKLGDFFSSFLFIFQCGVSWALFWCITQCSDVTSVSLCNMTSVQKDNLILVIAFLRKWRTNCTIAHSFPSAGSEVGVIVFFRSA